MPDMIFMDGGDIQMNAVKDVLKRTGPDIQLRGMVKNDTRMATHCLFGSEDAHVNPDPAARASTLFMDSGRGAPVCDYLSPERPQ